LEALDRERLHVTCYSDNAHTDPMTKRIKAACGAWTEVHGRSDDELAQIVLHDEVDVLVDLAGHTARHRLLAFARRPAPVQVTWMGYVGTSGLETMDVLLSDRFHTPLGEDQYYSEEIVRLPDGYVCYAPPENAPPVAELPASALERFTFGCFNNPAKISDEAIVLWAAVLTQLPDSRLLLKYSTLDSQGAATHLTHRLAAHGIERHRLILEGPAPHPEFLGRYNAVDLALDTFPYSGGLTTCEALWMGVPVITLPGPTFAGRHAQSHLTNAGLAGLVAATPQQYLDIAARLAADRQRLSGLRRSLRDQVAQSPLCDSQRFARALERALLDIAQRVKTRVSRGRDG
jgi:predicted O-linked N-acetylglucosamine transferase (SPINDLY family)